MGVTQKENGPIDEILSDDGFLVHGMMFTVGDLIQCAFLMSNTLYESVVNNPTCNAYMITLDTSTQRLLITAMVYNSAYVSCVLKNKAETPEVIKTYSSKNTYTRFDENNVFMVMTKGYVIDNFSVQPSYHDFLVEEGKPHVLVEACDIESLTVEDPYVE